MARNTGKGHRKGAVANREQVYNSKTNKYIKIDKKTGKFMKSKSTPFKGIKVKKTTSVASGKNNVCN
jgi:hypothetical protein